MRFSDGMEINTNGSLRIIEKSDGLYVVGEGYCIPCNSSKEAKETLADMKKHLGNF